MKFISAKTHGIIDYFLSGLLIVSPWVFNFYRDSTETWFPVVLGLSAIILNIMTDYKYSMMRVVSLQNHLTSDFLWGILLAFSPWVFGFYHYVFMPHVVFGVFQVLLSVTTQTPKRKNRQIYSLLSFNKH